MALTNQAMQKSMQLLVIDDDSDIVEYLTEMLVIEQAVKPICIAYWSVWKQSILIRWLVMWKCPACAVWV